LRGGGQQTDGEQQKIKPSKNHEFTITKEIEYRLEINLSD
jgi:hypothetical protein